MKSKHMRIRIPALAAVVVACLVLSLTFVGCSNKFMEVRIEVPGYKGIDFAKYDRLLYADLIVESTPKGYNPETEVREFFLKDLPGILSKDIEAVDAKGKTADEKIEWAKQNQKDPGGTLLITGKLVFDVKTRSKVEEVKEHGKRVKRFVKLQNWGLVLEVVMTELETGKKIFEKEFKEKMAGADVKNPKYNFEALFFKQNSRLQKELTSAKRTQRRYLLRD